MAFNNINTSSSASSGLYTFSQPLPIDPIYQNQLAQMKIAQHPLSIRAVDISLQEQPTCRQLDETHFSDLWEIRYIADTHLAKGGHEHRLCYSQLEAEQSPTFQVTAYSDPPEYIDNRMTRTIYSIFQQTKVLFRTFFPIDQQPEAALEQEHAFWSSLDREISYTNSLNTGQGALTQQEVIQKQIIFPNSLPSDDNEILLLYNYAPLRTGGEQMHFLLIPNPTQPAKHFLELNKQQYIPEMIEVCKILYLGCKIFER